MNVSSLMEKIKKHPDIHKAGMILCHNGIVRNTSRDGRMVRGLRVSVDQDMLEKIILENKNRPGIVEILVEIAEGKDLAVGEDVMIMAVAGDIRENVIKALENTLNAVKTRATKKTEFYK